MGHSSPNRLTAIDDQVMADHVVGGLAGQVHDGGLQVGDLRQPTCRDLGEPLCHQWLQILGLLQKANQSSLADPGDDSTE